MKNNMRKHFLLLSLSFFLIFLFILDISTGDLDIQFSQLLDIVTKKNNNGIENIIINQIRIPIALMAIAVGFSLALSGCLLQTVLNNPLASPFSLGISAAAGFGAALTIVYASYVPSFLNSSLTIAFSAFIFALLSSTFIFFMGILTRGNVTILILIGIATFFAFQSLLSAVQYFASPEESQYITFWLFGSLARSDYVKVNIVFLVFIFSFVYALKNSWLLTSLRLGDDGALAVGVPIKSTRLKFLFITSLLTASAIAFVGIIGFIGIVAPHVARMIIGEDHRFFIPCTVLIGGIFLELASITSKVIIPGVVFPIGIVTAIFGVPFFVALILWKRNQVIWN